MTTTGLYPAQPAEPSDPSPESTTPEELERYGIVRVPVDYFHVGGFRYTALADAIAQAKRDRRDD